MSAASAGSSGVGGLAASVVAGGGAREPGSGRLRRAGRSAAAVGRRESASKWQGAAGLFASLSPARKAPRAQLEREAVRSAGTPGASCTSRQRARDVEAVR